MGRAARNHLQTALLGTVLGAAGALLLGMAGAVLPASPASAEPGFDASWLGYDPADARSASTPLEAKLMRRAGGEWVIVQLGPPESAVPAALAALPAAPAPDALHAPSSVGDYVGVQAALRDYERAFERRDAALLSRVWIMNRSEMDQIERLFSESGSISVSIDDSDIQIDGDGASVRFAQTLTASRHSAFPRFRRRSPRSLVASDAAGSWDLDSLLSADGTRAD